MSHPFFRCARRARWASHTCGTVAWRWPAVPGRMAQSTVDCSALASWDATGPTAAPGHPCEKPVRPSRPSGGRRAPSLRQQQRLGGLAEPGQLRQRQRHRRRHHGRGGVHPSWASPSVSTAGHPQAPAAGAGTSAMARRARASACRTGSMRWHLCRDPHGEGRGEGKTTSTSQPVLVSTVYKGRQRRANTP